MLAVACKPTFSHPKSTKPSRIQENIDVFDFELSAEEMAAIGTVTRKSDLERVDSAVEHAVALDQPQPAEAIRARLSPGGQAPSRGRAHRRSRRGSTADTRRQSVAS
jgi:hypothetical protein